MKANTRCLRCSLITWSVEDDAFMIDQMPLRIEVEDIYFITGLSRRGEVVHSRGRTRGSLSIEDYVHIYCPGHPEKVGSQIPIKHVESLSLEDNPVHHSSSERISFSAPGITANHELGSRLSHHCV
jgi:hypothetical protein